MRVVSLLPAATDIVAALGAGDQLVGCTHECDWPPELVADIPVVTSTGLPPHLTSREIADAVASDTAHQGSSLYQLDLHALAELAPDVLLTQDLCEACAVSYRSVNQAVRVLELDTVVMSLEPHTIGGILESIDAVADLLGRSRAGTSLRGQLERRLEALPGPGPNGPLVLFVEWLDPLMPGGHWVPEQIRYAGGRPLLLEPGQHSVPQPWSAVVEVQPEVLVLGPCGFTPERTRAELPALSDLPQWRRLPAVRDDQVWIVDGPSLFNRPGPRVVDGAELLAGVLGGHAPPEACRVIGGG